MSEAYTKGPWHWWTSNSWKRLMTDHDHGKIVRVLEPYVVRDSHADLVVSEADMKLIAAAPDLLEALTELLSALYDTANTDHVSAMLNYARAEKKARLAISKATSQIKVEG